MHDGKGSAQAAAMSTRLPIYKRGAPGLSVTPKSFNRAPEAIPRKALDLRRYLVAIAVGMRVTASRVCPQ